MREKFERELIRLRDEILRMGSMVEEELTMALQALEKLDTDLAQRVIEADVRVNETRYRVEGECFTLIATQQPAAGDLRFIVAVMNMIVDLERMGDQARGIAKIVPQMVKHPGQPLPPELKQMGDLDNDMLRQTMTAYADSSTDLAQEVIKKDHEVDELFARVYTQIMESLSQTKSPGEAEACYEILRAARELERFGDLATNVAERVIYVVTGRLQDNEVVQA
jgi:phosphate transport system protein